MTCDSKCTVDCGRCKGNPPATLPTLCEWYALCFQVAVGTVDHPILGPVPICQRCADKHDLTPSTVPTTERSTT